jgi:hypothetical protein
MFKLLIERSGLLFAVTLKSRAYFFFISTSLVGAKIAPTTDPFEGIVEVCNYVITRIVRDWDKLHLLKLMHPSTE